MSQGFENLSKEIEVMVNRMFEEHTSSLLVYHNIHHTQKVVEHTMEIAAYYSLPEEENFILKTAAWFHDTGQLFVAPALHELESVRIADAFLATRPIVTTKMRTVIRDCILATKLPQQPHTILEQILCDADLYHLGTEAFWKINKLVKEEARLRGMNIDHWENGTLNMLQHHHFHTSYCNMKLAAGKAHNLQLLLQYLKGD